jgi:uncharacterized membrane protein
LSNTTTRYLIGYAATTVVFVALDMVWLKFIAADWYQQGMGHLMAPKVNLVAGALFYVIFPIGLMVFAIVPGAEWWRAALLGALFGLFAYATYDLTCLAVLKDWPVGLSILDVAWGALVSAVAAGAGWWAFSRIG